MLTTTTATMSEGVKMHDVMVEEANLWYGESSHRKRKFASSPPASPVFKDCDGSAVDEDMNTGDSSHQKQNFEKSPGYSPRASPDLYDCDWSSDEDDVIPAEHEKYYLHVQESLGFDIDCNHVICGIIPGGNFTHGTLFAKVGLHCYNMDKGKKLQFNKLVKLNTSLGCFFEFYSTSEVIDPLDDNSVHTFQALVTDEGMQKKAPLVLRTQICRIKPQIPGRGDITFDWDDDAVDDFYTTDMPDWPLNDEDGKLSLYEVKKSELEENEWLYLFAEFALFSEWRCDMSANKPFEIQKVMVQTKEDVASSLKLKSSNAMFYIDFKTRVGTSCKGIVRRTCDGRGHMRLEARCSL